MPLIETQPDAVAMTYAKSLFQAATAEGDSARNGGLHLSEVIAGELSAIMDMARSDKNFGEFLASKIIDRQSRDATLVRIFQGRVHNTSLNILRVLNRRDRLFVFPGVVAAFDEMVQEALGRVEIDVYSATPLDQAQKDQLANSLAAKLGKQPVLHTYVEPTMIGGLKIQIGDKLIDGSLATQLSSMRDQLQRNGAPAVRAAADRIFSAGQ
jgi:F-type H+-transporting ATPase subunit delta